MAVTPPIGTLTEGFLVIGYEEKADAEKALGVTISTDEALWETNEFTQFAGGEWKQDSVEKVVLLFTYLALNSVAKLRMSFTQFAMDEYADLPWGSQEQNKWFVHGYVNERQRVVRSREGKSMGQWFLQTLEPDSTPEQLKYEMYPENGGYFVISFERA